MTTSLIAKASDGKAIRTDPFAVLRELTAAVNAATVKNFDDPMVQKAVLYALENRSAFGAMAVALDSLLQARGLFPYVAKDCRSTRDLLALEAHRPLGLPDVVLHAEQLEVYVRLMEGENVVLSAPTSFGKSLLIDAVIASGKFSNVAVVVPTIALIDETRRRLAHRFGTLYKLITHASQDTSSRNIFVMTQERVLDFEELPPIDFFVIDEFYKLDPRRDPDRSLLLNHALYRLLQTGAQFYMLGPSIERIPEAFERSFPPS